MKVVDLFCGAGGFCEGFRQAGFEIVAGVDNWSIALQSFKQNFPNAEVIYKDVCYLNSKDLPNFDVLIGSPPCQEWSIGKQGTRTFDKKLIHAFERLVEEANPKYWVWECVPETIKLVDKCSYEAILNAYDFGVPQVRKRAFHSNFPLPEGQQKGKSIDETFGWKQTKVLFNHRSLNTRAHTPVYLSNRPARTAVTWPIRIYKEGTFTVEMMAEIQGFPRNYYFSGTEVEKYRQIGNAVCPSVAKAIAKSLTSLSKGAVK